MPPKVKLTIVLKDRSEKSGMYDIWQAMTRLGYAKMLPDYMDFRLEPIWDHA